MKNNHNKHINQNIFVSRNTCINENVERLNFYV